MSDELSVSLAEGLLLTVNNYGAVVVGLAQLEDASTDGELSLHSAQNANLSVSLVQVALANQDVGALSTAGSLEGCLASLLQGCTVLLELLQEHLSISDQLLKQRNIVASDVAVLVLISVTPTSVVEALLVGLDGLLEDLDVLFRGILHGLEVLRVDRVQLRSLKRRKVGLVLVVDLVGNECVSLVQVALQQAELARIVAILGVALATSDVGNGVVVVEGLLFVVSPSLVSALVVLQCVSYGSASVLNVLLSLCELLGSLVGCSLVCLVVCLLGTVETVGVSSSGSFVELAELVVVDDVVVGCSYAVAELSLGDVLSFYILGQGCVRLVEAAALDVGGGGVLSESRDCNTGNTGGYCDSTCESGGANTVLEHVIPL